MLSKENNELLTKTGPGTPMGDLLRRYWIPALLSKELPEPDCPQVRVKLLGEELIAFRDSNGDVGLIDEYCPHRKVSLYYGQNANCGIRCAYHGWKFNVNGQCVDMPSEPQESNFKSKIKIKSYPCVERGGVIWTYMGPPELKPELPEQEWMMVPESHRFVTRKWQKNNYFQAIEGGIDSSHVSILHANALKGLGVSKESKSPELLTRDTSPKFEVVETDYGLLIGAKRDAEPGKVYWRITQFIMPFYTMIPPFGGAPRGGHAWVPMDDENCWTWSWNWNPTRPLTKEELEPMQKGLGIHAELLPGSQCETKLNKENEYMMDRNLQRTGESISGIVGVGMQDQAVQESQGSIADRSIENLGTSDTAIIKARKILLDAAKNLQKGIEPPALNASSHHLRAASILLEEGLPFQEGAKEALKLSNEDYEAV